MQDVAPFSCMDKIWVWLRSIELAAKSILRWGMRSFIRKHSQDKEMQANNNNDKSRSINKKRCTYITMAKSSKRSGAMKSVCRLCTSAFGGRERETKKAISRCTWVAACMHTWDNEHVYCWRMLWIPTDKLCVYVIKLITQCSAFGGLVCMYASMNIVNY